MRNMTSNNRPDGPPRPPLPGWLAAAALVLVVALGIPQPAESGTLVRGFVRDAHTGEGLAATSVQVKDTYSATIASDDGEYLLYVDHFPAALVVTRIGYRSAERLLPEPVVDVVDFRLTPVPLVFEPTVVSGEDPAVRIMRRVIEEKQRWRSQMHSYQVAVYSRWTVAKRTGVVGVVEVASEMYWDEARGLGERVQSRRTTDNIDGGGLFGEFTAIDLILNFYEDDIELLGHRILGPTHPQALEHYDFELIGQRRLDDAVVHDITMSPRSKLQPAFAGTLAVLDGQFAVLEATLVPTRTTVELATIGVSEFGLAYKQQYRPFGDGMWLPVDFRIAIDMVAGLPGLRFPFMRRDIVQRLSDYQVNPVLPDSLFVRKQFERPDASQADSLFAHFRDAIPLSAAETEAYASIDSTVTLLESFRPSGVFARFMPPPATADTSTRDKGPLHLAPTLRANRVDAFFFGAEAEYALASSWLAHVGGGYSAGQKRWSYGGGVESTWGTERPVTLRAAYRADLDERYDSYNFSQGYNSLEVVLGGEDYFDYFRNERLAIELSARRTPADLLFRLGFNDERHRSLRKSRRFDLLDRYEGMRPNPPIERGTLRSLVFAVEHGQLYPPWSLTARRGLRAQVEYADRSLGGDFSFARFHLYADWTVSTLLERRAPANPLHVRVVAGTASGDLPVQRFGTLDAASSGFTPFGGFRSLRDLPYEGKHFLGVFWEQYLRTLPFELLDWQLPVDNGMGVVVHGASGRTWIPAATRAGLGYRPVHADSFHHEAGLSVILFHFLRVDVVRRLDQPQWRAGVSLAQLDFR